MWTVGSEVPAPLDLGDNLGRTRVLNCFPATDRQREAQAGQGLISSSRKIHASAQYASGCQADIGPEKLYLTLGLRRVRQESQSSFKVCSRSSGYLCAVQRRELSYQEAQD